MAGVNKAILIGNLGRDPELRRTPGGSPVANFTLATTERRTDKDGKRSDRTEWHNIVAWGKLAELANQYLKKGRTVYIEGRITTRSWDDKDGNKKYRTEIFANTIQFLSPAGDSAGSRQATPDMADNSGFDPGPAPVEHEAVAEDDLPF